MDHLIDTTPCFIQSTEPRAGNKQCGWCKLLGADTLEGSTGEDAVEQEWSGAIEHTLSQSALLLGNVIGSHVDGFTDRERQLIIPDLSEVGRY